VLVAQEAAIRDLREQLADRQQASDGAEIEDATGAGTD
jgi:hypothetical protein